MLQNYLRLKKLSDSSNVFQRMLTLSRSVCVCVCPSEPEGHSLSAVPLPQVTRWHPIAFQPRGDHKLVNYLTTAGTSVLSSLSFLRTPGL